MADDPAARIIFISLPVRDLARSMRFYAALGFTNNPRFTDETAACMRASDTVNLMLLTHAKWREFTTRPIPPSSASEMALIVSQDSRDTVNRLVELAPAHGGILDVNPAQDLGFMFSRAVADPDGHVVEMLWMDPAAMAAPPA